MLTQHQTCMTYSWASFRFTSLKVRIAIFSPFSKVHHIVDSLTFNWFYSDLQSSEKCGTVCCSLSSLLVKYSITTYTLGSLCPFDNGMDLVDNEDYKMLIKTMREEVWDESMPFINYFTWIKLYFKPIY